MARVIVIIPAYNEADTIETVLRGLETQVPDYDVVVVNDGSSDDTARIVSRCPNAALVSLPYNMGIGVAVQTGYKYAQRQRYDIAVQCDADGQHPVQQIPRLVEHVLAGDGDLIIGSRYVADTGYSPSVSRRVGKSIMSRLVDVVVGRGITDTTSGFRAANRRVINIFARHYPDDFPEPESVVILHKAGLKVAETPVDMMQRQGGRTSINPRRAVYYMIKVAFAIFMDIFRKFTHTPEEI